MTIQRAGNGNSYEGLDRHRLTMLSQTASAFSSSARWADSADTVAKVETFKDLASHDQTESNFLPPATQSS